ncbi:MAG TPA: hypothetical protein VFN52_07060 [Acidiferrobacteraceae bacterium]|nr:hypothetical protein [Acidiferrobacteraceae bacterium]
MLRSILLCALLTLLESGQRVWARVVLPGYAQSAGLQSELEQKGHAITSVLSLVVAILSIFGIMIGAAHFALGNGERGRSFVVGGVVALVLASTAYAIVGLVARG